MKLAYNLDENDFLQQQLYTASNSESVKKQKRKSWVHLIFTFFFISIMFTKNTDKFTLYFLIIIGVIIVIFYPFYLRNFYKNHYQKFIKDTYKNRFGENATVQFLENEVLTADSTAESKIK